MSAKTKIVVLRMKEVIYTGIFAVLGILLLVLLIMMFLPDKVKTVNRDTTASIAETTYIPGIYTTELILGGHAVDIEIILEAEAITSIRLVNLSEAVTTMYPLLQPTFDNVCRQVYETQSLDHISYTADSKYTSLVLLQAIGSSLDKARPTASPTAAPAAPAASPTVMPAVSPPS